VDHCVTSIQEKTTEEKWFHCVFNEKTDKFRKKVERRKMKEGYVWIMMIVVSATGVIVLRCLFFLVLYYNFFDLIWRLVWELQVSINDFFGPIYQPVWKPHKSSNNEDSLSLLISILMYPNAYYFRNLLPFMMIKSIISSGWNFNIQHSIELFLFCIQFYCACCRLEDSYITVIFFIYIHVFIIGRFKR
jgi:hypothetical protein